RAGAVSCEDLQGPIVVLPGDSQIQIAVVIEVPHGQGVRVHSRSAGDRSLERSVSVSQQDVNGLSVPIAYGEVEFAIFVEVAGHDASGRSAGTSNHGGRPVDTFA